MAEHSQSPALLFCLHAYYDFVRLEDQTTERKPSPDVLSELALNIGLLACWHADLQGPWLPCMAAADASGSFGFGLCTANCPPELSRQVASLGGVTDHHLRLERPDGDPEKRPRS